MYINSKWYLGLFLVPLIAVIGFGVVLSANISRTSQKVINFEDKLSADLIAVQDKFYSDLNTLEQEIVTTLEQEIVTTLNSVQNSLMSEISTLEQEIIFGLIDVEETLIHDLSVFKQEISSNLITSIEDLTLRMLEDNQTLVEDVDSLQESFDRDITILEEDIILKLSEVEKSLMSDVDNLSIDITDKNSQIDQMISELADVNSVLVTEIEDSNELLSDRIDTVNLRLDDVYDEFVDKHSDLDYRITSQDEEFFSEFEQNFDVQDNLSSSISALSSDMLDLSSIVLELSDTHKEINSDTVEIMNKLNRSTLDAVPVYERTIDSVVDILESGEITASGFIYGDQANYVVTAWHVVKNSSNPSVRLSDGTNINARVIATNRPEDVALLKMDESVDAEPLSFADSSGLLIGQPVLVLGSPAGLTGSATTGVISAVGRKESDFDNNSFSSWHHPSDLVQIDAAVNPGNSGGPVLNSDGEVIGIMSFILTWGQDGGNTGLNFAVASDVVKQFTDSIIK